MNTPGLLLPRVQKFRKHNAEQSRPVLCMHLIWPPPCQAVLRRAGPGRAGPAADSFIGWPASDSFIAWPAGVWPALALLPLAVGRAVGGEVELPYESAARSILQQGKTSQDTVVVVSRSSVDSFIGGSSRQGRAEQAAS
jgi:hypothetical protein